MKQLIAQIAPSLIDAIGAILASIVALVFARLSSLIAAHAKNARVEGVLKRLNDTVFNVVMAIEQTTVAAAKKVATEGKLDRAAAETIKQAALDEVKSHLGPKGLAELKDVLGIHELELDAFLGQRIESGVATHTRF